ncbi:UNVERIFIED_CONTAM: hypothetical protein FKN15_031255 [Acipenser sinensis]
MPERQEPGPMREMRPTERRKREEELRPPEPEEAGQPLDEFLPSVQSLLLKPSLTFSDVMGLTRRSVSTFGPAVAAGATLSLTLVL